MQVENEGVAAVTDTVGDAVSFFSMDNAIKLWEVVSPYIVKGIFALLILWIGSKIAKKVGDFVKAKAIKAPNVDQTLANFIGSVVRYVILAMVFIAAIGQVGVQTASLVAILGAASLAIGLALQGTMSNVA